MHLKFGRKSFDGINNLIQYLLKFPLKNQFVMRDNYIDRRVASFKILPSPHWLSPNRAQLSDIHNLLPRGIGPQFLLASRFLSFIPDTGRHPRSQDV
jgi:hypothetical protein